MSNSAIRFVTRLAPLRETSLKDSAGSSQWSFVVSSNRAVNLVNPYSLNASVGFTLVARSAGMMLATTATANSTTGSSVNVAGSRGET